MLWLSGPPGVGKTTIGWEIFRELTLAGIETGYVDIDQLGICYPEPASDPGRHRMKAVNLGAVLASFRAAGSRCAIVSGVVDASHGVHVDQIPNAALTVCRLRIGRDELGRRLVGRGADLHQVREALREADAMDVGHVADVCVDTSGLPIAEVVRQVRGRTDGWPVLTDPGRASKSVQPEVHPAIAANGRVLWLCGATGVGKSTVGFEIYQRAMRAELTAAYIDLDQLGFYNAPPADDPGNHQMKARSLASLWQTYRTVGAQRLIMVGPVDDEASVKTYTDAMPAATVTLCRLHAGRDQLTQRIMLRGQGGSWSQPGDPLKGQTTAYLLRVVDQAAADADAMERDTIGELRIDTDGRTVEEVASVITTRSRWPGRVE